MSVSVAIATYKRSAMVRQAVEAALGQTRAPFEVVVTDDASPATIRVVCPRPIARPIQVARAANQDCPPMRGRVLPCLRHTF